MADMILPFTLPFTLGGDSAVIGPGLVIPFVVGGLGEEPPPPPPPPPVSVAAGTAGATLDVTVRLQALDGTWETCGADRAIKVSPETLALSHNEWGADKASFDLHRSPIAIWPDIGAFSPVEVEVGGVVVWEGRTAETPLRSGAEQVINVQCQGWQYHMDDDVYRRTYVHAKLTDWKDSRSFNEAPLPYLKTSGSVESGQGQIILGWAKGANVAHEQGVAVTLDFGLAPGHGAVTAAIDTQLTGGGGEFQFYVIAHGGWGVGYGWEGREDIVSAAGLVSGTYLGGAVLPSRYITLLVYRAGPEIASLGEDVLLKIIGARVFSDATYDSGGASVLKATAIVKDAVERATTLLSGDYSQIAATSFNIPDFALSKASTPREAIEAANAYHNYATKLLSGSRFSFQPRPTDATLELGAFSGADIQDASANNGAEIYNRALIEATGPDSSPLSVERTSTQQPGVLALIPTSPSPDNPSFDTNTEHWSVSGGGSIERNIEAANYRSAPGSGRWTPAEGSKLTLTFTGTFKKSKLYRLTYWHKGPLTFAAFGVASDQSTEQSTPQVEGEWKQREVQWTPSADRSGVTLTLTIAPGLSLAVRYIDDVVLRVAEPTLVDRRGFRRTKVIQFSSAITPVEGSQLADIFLQSHMGTPFKGSASVVPGGVRRVLGGAPVHPSQLGLHTQELVRLSHLIDPDTGGVSRDATIAEVAYTHRDQKAQVTLDSKRGNFDALLARLAVVQSAKA